MLHRFYAHILSSRDNTGPYADTKKYVNYGERGGKTPVEN